MPDAEIVEREPRRFVAIDGEGLTRGGQHDYVLLAASDGSYIESYEPNGLGTADCFNYLLDVGERHAGAVLVGFYTSYDTNMMFRDLPADVLEGLWLGEQRTWRATDGDFRAYRIEYIPNRVLKLREGCWSFDERTERFYWHTFRSVVFWDCFQFFQMSFVKALRDWKVTEPDAVDAIAGMKDARGVFTAEQREQIRAYCFDECRLLVEMMSRVSETLDNLDIRLTSWYGAGSIASAVLKARGAKAFIRRDWGEDVENAVMGAYYGGRVETFAVGIVDTASWNYDVRSAYPSATAELPPLVDSVVQHVDSYDYQAPYALWRVRWQRRANHRRPIRLAPFPFRHQKRIFWPHTGEGWYHAAEVRAAMDVFSDERRGIKIDIIEGYIIHCTSERPFAWVRELYAERAEYKRHGDPREKILKLALNSLYGKFAQSIGGKDGAPPPYQCYMYAGMITADCRAKLLRAAAAAGEVFAIATDGIFTRERIDGLVESEELGAWESTTVEPGLMLIQPGVYATPNLGRVAGSFAKTRGFGSKGLNYGALAREWRKRRMAGAVRISETRFIGFGYALAVGKLATLWRRWIAGDKLIHFSGTTSKTIDPTSPHDAELVRLASPAPPAEISAEYVPRKRGRDDARDVELQAELLASQPDMDDNQFSWRG